MSTHNPIQSQPSKAILQSTPALKELLEKAHLIEIMNTILIPLLPQECQPYCRVANVRDKTLIIGVSNQQVITSLRFIIPDLLPLLRNCREFAAIETIKTKIIFTEKKAHVAPLKSATLTTEQRTTLNQLKEFLKEIDLKRR